MAPTLIREELQGEALKSCDYKAVVQWNLTVTLENKAIQANRVECIKLTLGYKNNYDWIKHRHLMQVAFTSFLFM